MKMTKSNFLIGKFIRTNDQFHNIILGHRCLYGLNNIVGEKDRFLLEQLYDFYNDAIKFPQTDSMAARQRFVYAPY